MKKQGIVLIAVGNQGYAYMAANLAFSIKRVSPSVDITLYADGFYEHIRLEDRKYFDDVRPIELADYTTNGAIDPGKIKTGIADKLPYRETLYVDVDSLCLKDIRPMLTALSRDKRSFIGQEMGRGSHAATDIQYNIWSSAKDIAEHFEVAKDKDIVAVQSSWFYVKQNKTSKAFLSKVQKAFEEGYDKKKITQLWGGGYPDELFFSGVVSALGMDIKWSNDVMYFGDKLTGESPTDVQNGYYFLSLFGNGTGRTKMLMRYWEMYDGLLNKWARQDRDAGGDKRHNYKAEIIRKFKHANRN